jgi:hypothetical protein
MRRTQTVLVALIAAATLVALAAPAGAASRSFATGSTRVRAGQQLWVSGKGCQARTSVRIYLSGVVIDSRGTDSQGRFSGLVEIPSRTSLGEQWIKAGCNGHWLGAVKITVLRSRFSVRPRTVEPGDSITVSGSGCPAGSWAVIRLDDRIVAASKTDRHGRFSVRVQIPSTATEDAHRVSARCHRQFVGAQLIDVINGYLAQRSLLTTDRTAVPAGQRSPSAAPSAPPATRRPRWTAA